MEYSKLKLRKLYCKENNNYISEDVLFSLLNDNKNFQGKKQKEKRQD